MASNSSSSSNQAMSAEVLLTKRVQDMVLQGEDEEPPSLYVCRNKQNDDHNDDHIHLAPIPTLDLRQVSVDPSPRPDLVMGLKPHADNSGYTLILQDEVQGLQISKHGKWLTVPANPDAIFVLLGDQMEIMTNGTFKSTVHRVVSNSGQTRTSIAVFYTPEEEKEVGPAEALINEKMNQPRAYKPVINYAEQFMEFYNKGQRAIHLAQI